MVNLLQLGKFRDALQQMDQQSALTDMVDLTFEKAYCLYKVWPLTQFYFHFCKINHGFAFREQISDPSCARILFVCSLQALPRLSLGPLEGFLS